MVPSKWFSWCYMDLVTKKVVYNAFGLIIVIFLMLFQYLVAKTTICHAFNYITMVLQIGVKYYAWFQWRCMFWINVNHFLDCGNEITTLSWKRLDSSCVKEIICLLLHFFIKCVYLSSFVSNADTIPPLQQTGLGSTCSKNPLIKKDNV